LQRLLGADAEFVQSSNTVSMANKRKNPMRVAALIILMLTAAFAPQPAMAAYNLPWCAQYDDSNILSCAFTSMRQCWESVSGVGGFCRPNFRYAVDPPGAEPRRVKRRFDSAYH